MRLKDYFTFYRQQRFYNNDYKFQKKIHKIKSLIYKIVRFKKSFYNKKT